MGVFKYEYQSPIIMEDQSTRRECAVSGIQLLVGELGVGCPQATFIPECQEWKSQQRKPPGPWSPGNKSHRSQYTSS